MLTPQTPGELAEALGSAGSRKQTVALNGAGSKRRMAGPLPEAEVVISTAGLGGIVQYEPGDLTISVCAGMRWRELVRVLAEKKQMIPLDPPFGEEATVGGVVAANTSGPRRRLYGTARDMVIGMKFALIDGRLAQTGGMVVKNVAGLDMAKLLIGSFGTLAAIAVVNFKVTPKPTRERSFLVAFPDAREADRARMGILKSVLQPEALDVLSPEVSRELGAEGWTLAVQAGGNEAVVSRYERELAAFGDGRAFEGAHETALWRAIVNFVPQYLTANPDGAVVRVGCALKDVAAVMEAAGGAAVARGGAGVVYAGFRYLEFASAFAGEAVKRGWRPVIEFAPERQKRNFELWPSPGEDLEIMKRVKRMFDPEGLLNRGRMYGRI
ncbi:MAG: FAD-binding oxidoreductase [Bryobacteraceae bacterium]